MIYEYAAGTIRGTTHRENNQDAYSIGTSNGITVALVADGCSAGKFSHVGSNLFCMMLRTELLNTLSVYYPTRSFEYCLNRAARRVCSHMDLLTSWGSRSFIIEQFFLFTIVGCAITEDRVYYFNLGDGCIIDHKGIIDCDTGSAAHNTPPYLAYRIADTTSTLDLDFKIIEVPLDDFESVLIGSDGVNDLITLEDRFFPATDKPIGSIQQFWTNDHYFTNPDNVRRTLFRINNEKYRASLNTKGQPVLKKHPGLLPDDTTMVIIRRTKEQKEEEVS